MQPTQDQINELRTNFFAKLEESEVLSEDAFHPADIARIQNSDHWLQRFLEHHDLNQNEALTMLWDTCEWRKKFGTNDINESTVRMDYLIEGSFFTHNRDKDGCRLFIFKCKKHVKGQRDFDEIKRCVVYWFERLERLDNGQQVTLFFDMADTGLSNMDMEFTKYLIGLFKQYYPNFLNYILIFEMPWVLNAAFKIIKSWLPAKAVQKIKFVNIKSLNEYVTPEQSLKCWGGQDDYVFSFVPDTTLDGSSLDNISNGNNNKKVHFADGSPMTETAMKKFESDPNVSLVINPPEIIIFTKEGNDLIGSFMIKNKSTQNISYKIKTTSPEKFRVRPSSGCLKENEQSSINVALQQGFQLGGLTKDKFLIMCMPVQSLTMTIQEINELWKNSSGKQIEQHRLRCGESSGALTRNGTAIALGSSDAVPNQITNLINSIQKLSECQIQLQKSVRRIQIMQLLTLLLFISLALLGFYVLKEELTLNVAEQSCYRSK